MGVAALARRQTRWHRDLDLAVDAVDLGFCLVMLGRLGYPVAFDEDGHGRQADLDGGVFDYPPDAFSRGLGARRSPHRGPPPPRRAAPRTKKKPGTAVRASGTSLFGVGPVIAAIVIGEVRDASRFRNRDHFAACNGTAPIEVSSGGRKVHRLSRRGNRRVSHAIHMAAITQIRQPHSEGRACYDKKLAEGKTRREALRALKRQVSDAVFARLRADASRAQAQVRGPGGQ
jgi:hypothetical protein